MPCAEFACVFARPPRERLVAAERLVRAIPGWLDGAVAEVDLFRATATGYVAALVRAASGGISDAAIARLAFWTARAGGNGFTVDDLLEVARDKVRGEMNLCDRFALGLPAADLGDAAARLLRHPKNPPTPDGPPPLALDLDGRGRDGLLYQPGRTSLFVPSVLAPPVGDALLLAVRAAKTGTIEGWARVVEVIARGASSAGRPAGFALQIEGPRDLHELLAARLPATGPVASRTAPRFAVSAPVTVGPAAPGTPAAPAIPSPSPAPRARLEYATDEELAADWVENLSHGGAFIRTTSPHPVGTSLTLGLSLPDGVRLEAQAVVTAVDVRGMGVRFVLDRTQDDALAAVIARISARPRRALVVDDDALGRQMLADALAARGFEVLTAAGAEEGVLRLTDELLALDLLVTDLHMPGLGGEKLVRYVRRVGGESELAIVVVTGRMEPGLEERLLASGADAVVDKGIGPEHVAAAADAAQERKRPPEG